MYSIYINERPIILCRTKELEEYQSLFRGKTVLTSLYSGKVKSLLQHIDMMEKGQNNDAVIIHSDKYGRLKKDFKSLFAVVKASGGLVENEKGEFLFIFRRGYWDLPKGKLDKREAITDAAIREVMEETGVNNVILGPRIVITKHMFRSGKSRAIKKSYWYHMNCLKQKLVPQAEEDIKDAIWSTIEDFEKYRKPVYCSIKDVIRTFKEINASIS